MGNLSQLAQITYAAVALLFADLACMSASRANLLIELFPEYRAAKDDPEHTFWSQKGIEMVTACRAEINAYDSNDCTVV